MMFAMQFDGCQMAGAEKETNNNSIEESRDCTTVTI